MAGIILMKMTWVFLQCYFFLLFFLAAQSLEVVLKGMDRGGGRWEGACQMHKEDGLMEVVMRKGVHTCLRGSHATHSHYWILLNIFLCFSFFLFLLLLLLFFLANRLTFSVSPPLVTTTNTKVFFPSHVTRGPLLYLMCFLYHLPNWKWSVITSLILEHHDFNKELNDNYWNEAVTTIIDMMFNNTHVQLNNGDPRHICCS